MPGLSSFCLIDNYYRWRLLTDPPSVNRVLNRAPISRNDLGIRRITLPLALGVYLLTAACYEHSPIIGHSSERMSAFSSSLLKRLR